MQEAINDIVAFFFTAFLFLFGHAQVWSTIASVVSGLATFGIMILIVIAAMYIARRNHYPKIVRRIAKLVMIVLSPAVALLPAIVVGLICEMKLDIDPETPMLTTMGISAVAYIVMVVWLPVKENAPPNKAL